MFEQIQDKSWAGENIFEGFKSMDYKIMNSLRDTDYELGVSTQKTYKIRKIDSDYFADNT